MVAEQKLRHRRVSLKHMTKRISAGVILTLVWFALAAVYLSEISLGFTRLSLNQLPGLVLDNRNELAFFCLVLGYIWLVVGHFHQAAELREHSSLLWSTAEQTESALQKLEIERQKFDDYRGARARAAQPHWEVQGCIAHKEQHEINLRNLGAPASSLRADWNRRMPFAVVLSNATVVDRGQQLTIKVVFRDARLEKFDLTLHYCDALGDPHRMHISVAETAVTLNTEA